MEPRIFLSFPHMGGNEMFWIEEAFKGSWVVPLGPNVDEFEKRLASHLGASHVVAVSSGTAAIHMALVMLGVGPGDEVICQSFTFAASANPILYQGAKPVFVDSEPSTWNMDPVALEEAIVERHRITGRYPKAIIPVHLYGMPARMDEILAVANRYAIPVVEDAAEALGSEYKGSKCGTLGTYGTLSFNGNKIITTSGGGAVVCHSENEAERIVFYVTQARESKPYYYHEQVGYNYRMSNISAGIGCGQMDVLDSHIERRRTIHKMYSEAFAGHSRIQLLENPDADFNSNFWLSTIIMEGADPELTRAAMNNYNIETRWLWRPMHMQPIFADAPYYGGAVAENLFAKGLCLPSGSVLTDDDVNRVIDAIKHILR